MERATRLIVIASAALAAVTHAWLATWAPTLWAAALIAFAITFAIARFSLTAALCVVLGSAYVAPALLSLAFGPNDYLVILVWLAAAAGPVFAQADLARWHLPPGWTFPLAGWALVVALSWPIAAAREVDFSLVAARTLDSPQGIFVGSPPVAAAYVTVFALPQLLGILWIDLMWARYSGPGLARFYGLVVPAAIASAAVSSLVGIYQVVGDITWLNPAIWSSDNRAGGLMLDANSLGMGAAIWAPIAIAAAWQTGRKLWLAALAFVLLSGGMWVSSSRTALLTFVAGALGVFIGFLKRRGRWHPAIARLIVLVGASLCIVVLAVMPREFESSSAIGRAIARVPRLEWVEVRRFANELWDRFGYGRAATEMIREHPFAGVGVGGFHILAPNYIYRRHEGFRRVGPDNAQNWWRHELAELGLIGALPAICMSLLLLRLVTKSADDESTGMSTVLRMALIGIGAASLFGVPTQHPATLLSVATVIFLFAQSIHVPARAEDVKPAAGWWIAAMAVAVATAIGQLVSARGELRVPQRNAALGLPYAYGLSPVEGMSEFGEMRWLESEAVTVVPARRPWYQLTFWHPNPRRSGSVTVTVKIDDRVVFEREVAGPEPTTVFLEMPTGRQWVPLEFAVRPRHQPYALHVATQWHLDLPAGTPADRIAR